MNKNKNSDELNFIDTLAISMIILSFFGIGVIAGIDNCKNNKEAFKKQIIEALDSDEDSRVENFLFTKTKHGTILFITKPPYNKEKK